MNIETLYPRVGEFADRKTIRNTFGVSLENVGAPSTDQTIKQDVLIGAQIKRNPRVINLGILPKPQRHTVELVFGKVLEPVRAQALDQVIAGQEVMESSVIVSAPKPEIKKAQSDLLKNFTAIQEADSLQKKFNDGLAEGSNHEMVINRIVTENLANIRAYQWEYTMSDPILVNPVKLNENGELVNSKSEYPILGMTSKEEREGAVWESVVKTQTLLKEAKVGDSVMIVSPAGWSGRVDAQGKEIVYSEAEIFAFIATSDASSLKLEGTTGVSPWSFIKGEGRNIRALTFVADLDMKQCEQFRAAFITEPQTEQKKLTEKEKIIQMTASPLLVTGGKIKFENILDRIQAIKGGKIMREANGAKRTFTQAHEFLARGDELQELPDLCENVIETYEKYLRKNISNINNPAVHGAIKQRMEMTVFEIAKILRGDKSEIKQISNFYMQAMNANNLQILDTRVIDSNYDAIIHFLQTRPGCNGGGVTETSFMFGQNLGDILSGASGGSTLRGISGLSGEVTRCRHCNEEICEGRCYKCKVSYKKAKV